jgi:hypothetical protein
MEMPEDFQTVVLKKVMDNGAVCGCCDTTNCVGVGYFFANNHVGEEVKVNFTYFGNKLPKVGEQVFVNKDEDENEYYCSY